MIDVNMKGKVKWHGPLVRQATQEAANKPLLQCAALVMADAKKSMKRGGLVKWSNDDVSMEKGVPSTPPDPPNVQRGNLRASIVYALTRVATAIVGPTRMAWYGKVHEKGGEFGGRNYPARPFMLPALHRMKAKFPELFKKAALAHTKAGRILNSKKGLN